MGCRGSAGGGTDVTTGAVGARRGGTTGTVSWVGRGEGTTGTVVWGGEATNAVGWVGRREGATRIVEGSRESDLDPGPPPRERSL